MSHKGLASTAPDLRFRADDAVTVRTTLANSSALQSVVEAAAMALGAPIAAASIILDGEQVFPASVGLGDEREQWTFCSYALFSTDPLEVCDASTDPRFMSERAVLGPTSVRYYLGHAIHDALGYPIGTLSVIDREPREAATAEQRQLFAKFAEIVQELVREHVEKFRPRSLEAPDTWVERVAMSTWGVALRGIADRVAAEPTAPQVRCAIDSTLDELKVPQSTVNAVDVVVDAMVAATDPSSRLSIGTMYEHELLVLFLLVDSRVGLDAEELEIIRDLCRIHGLRLEATQHDGGVFEIRLWWVGDEYDLFFEEE